MKRLIPILAILLGFGLASELFAAPAVDVKFEKGFANAANTASFVSNAGTVTGTVSASATVLIGTIGLLCGVGTPSAITMTWNGVSMTQINSVTITATQFVVSFGLKNPTSGNQTLATNFATATCDVALGAVSFTGSDTAGTGWNNNGTDSGTGTSVSSTVTTSTNSIAVVGHANSNASSTTITAGTTQWVELALNGNSAEATRANNAGSTVLSWTLGSSVAWGNVKLNIPDASGGGGATPELSKLKKLQKLGVGN